ncbi:MAG TPA: glycosyltransferase family 39 protein, partial [Thermoanaerobaculia bacterium]
TLALFVTPLWDVPDEIGHLALVRDIAEGRGLARAGVSVLPDDLVARWRPEQAAGGPVFNWVAQHPPLYHLLAVPFLAAGRLASDEEQMRDRAPRLLSALSGAAALWVFFLLLREASRDALLAFAAASSVAFLPMWTHMSSGTNHDVLLGLILAVAALFFVRLVEAGSFGDAVAMGAALSLAGVTKLSALAVALPLLLVTGRHLASRGARRVWQWAATAVMALALPALWALRHRLLSVASPLHVTSGDPLSLSGLASYLRSNPVIDHTFKNFIGLIGWTGTGGGEVAWFQISGVFLAPFLLLAIALSVGTILWLAAGSPASRVRRASALASVAALASLTILAAPTSGGALAKGLVYALLVATSVFALTWMLRPRNSDDATVAESHFVLLAFAAAYLVNSWQAFRITGEMRATNGRYFFAVLPFLLLAFFLPAFRAWAQRFPARLLLGVPLVLAVNEAAFFAVRVLPFYRG